MQPQNQKPPSESSSAGIAGPNAAADNLMAGESDAADPYFIPPPSQVMPDLPKPSRRWKIFFILLGFINICIFGLPLLAWLVVSSMGDGDFFSSSSGFIVIIGLIVLLYGAPKIAIINILSIGFFFVRRRPRARGLIWGGLVMVLSALTLYLVGGSLIHGVFGS